MAHAILAGGFIGLFAISLVGYGKEGQTAWLMLIVLTAMGAAWQLASAIQP